MLLAIRAAGWTHGVYIGPDAVLRELSQGRPLMASLTGEPYWEPFYIGLVDSYDFALKTSRTVSAFRNAVVLPYSEGLISLWAAAASKERDHGSAPHPTDRPSKYLRTAPRTMDEAYPAFTRLVSGRALPSLAPSAFTNHTPHGHFCSLITKTIYMSPMYYVDALVRQAMAVLLAERKGLSAPCVNFGLAGTSTCPVGASVPGWGDGQAYVQSAVCMSRSRFVITMENIRLPGHISEKLLEGALSTAVPIYFGSPAIREETARDLQSGITRFVFCDFNMRKYRDLVFANSTDPLWKYKAVPKLLQVSFFSRPSSPRRLLCR